jgi:hypothetical protein
MHALVPSFIWRCRKDGQVCDFESLHGMHALVGCIILLLMTNGCEIRAFGLSFQFVKLQ